MRGIGIAFMALVLAACSSSTSTPAPQEEEADPGRITRAEFGGNWPFKVDSGTLSCTPSGANDGRLLVTFDVGDGIEYALNGQAKDFGFPELDDDVLAPDAEPVDVLPLIDRGLELCDE